LPLGKLHVWEVATWENALEKLPLGKWESTLHLLVYDMKITKISLCAGGKFFTYIEGKSLNER